MQVMIDGRPVDVAEFPRSFGVDIFNADSNIGATLTLTDKMHGRLIRFEGACTVTIPTGLRPDFSCGWSQDGDSAVTFVAAAGVTLQSLEGNTDSGGQYAVGGIFALSSAGANSASVFRLYGALA